MDGIALLDANAGTSPSGTGSFSFFTNFRVLVENLAFDKRVQILGHDVFTGLWNFHPCNFSSSVARNGEIWAAHVGSSPIDQFVAEYEALGNVFWDNNSGFNYLLDTHAAQSTDGIGSGVVNPNVLVVAQQLDGSGNLVIDVLIKNLAFAKNVGAVYTTDNWSTSHSTFGGFQQGFPPFGSPHQLNAELWAIRAPVGIGKHGQFAVFYGVNDGTFWDNNFGANYSF